MFLRRATLACAGLLLFAVGSAEAEEDFDRVLAEMGAEYYGQYCAS